MDNRRRVVLCVDSVKNGVTYNALAKVAVNIGSANTLVDSLIKTAVLNNNLIAVFNKKNSHTRILTKRNFFTSRNFVVFDNLRKYTFAYRRAFVIPCGFKGAHDVFADKIVAVGKQFFNRIAYRLRLDFSYFHIRTPQSDFDYIINLFYLYFNKQ